MKIIGTGSALPKFTVTNAMLSEFLDTSDEWIVPRTGIKTRQIITDENLHDLAIEASRKALDASGLKPEEIDYIICACVANNVVTPAIAAFVQGALGCTCPFMDINGACAGFIYALDTADAIISSGRATNVLVLSAEEPTRFVSWQQRETCVLFGDGAAAAVVTKSDNRCLFHLTGTSRLDVINYRRRLEPTPFEKEGVDFNSPMILKGREVFKMAVESSQRDLNYLMDKMGVTPDQVDYFLLHQANLRIVNAVREGMGLPEERFPSNIHKRGNTSSAGLPILLDEVVRKGKIKDGNIIAMSAFGAGFVTGALIMEW